MHLYRLLGSLSPKIASGSTFALGHCMQRAAILFLEIATDVSVTDIATNQLKL